MACRFEVTLPPRDRAGVAVACEALDEIDELEDQLTIFRENSEVSLINRRAAFAPVRVDPALFALLSLCQKLYRETEGAFDVTSGPLSHCWGFLRRENRVPMPDEIEAAMSCVGSDKLLLDNEALTVGFERSGVRINFGSIGKGYALDRVAAKMRGRVSAALLSAGSSSILAFGSGDEGRRGWSIGVRDPRHLDRRLAVLRLRDGAMSTSGSEEQSFVHEGHRYGHVIDPRSGCPADRVAGVTVVAGSAAVSDALATAFYVGGPELAERYCARHPEVLAIMLESNANRPVVIGSSRACEVEII